MNDGRPLVGDQFPTKRPGRNSNNRERNPTVHPFPNNIYTKTAYLIPENIKDKLLKMQLLMDYILKKLLINIV